MSATNTSLVTLDNAVGQRAQAEKYLDNILKFKPITSSKQSYSRFLDIFVSSVKSLKDLDVGDLTEYILYSVAMRKLDFKTRSEFEVIVNNENVEPTVKELVNFLEKQHLVQASKESVNADKTGRQRPRRSRNQNKRDAEKTSSGGIQGENSGEENGNSTQDGSKTPDSANKSLRKIRSRSARFEKLKCSDCEENNHPVETCEMFLNLSNEDRVNFAVAVKVCFTCLKPGHSRFSCPQKNNTCEKCSSRHHVLLHTETKRIRKFLIFKRTRSDKRNSNGPNDRSGSVSNGQSSTEQKLKNCILCEEKCHNLDVCEIFLGYDPEKRLVVIRKNRLCANCFATNHGSRRCPLKSNCDQCRGKHHDKVHEIFSLNRQSKTNDISIPENCILCNEKYHNLNVCDIFNSYEDPEKHLDVIRKNRLCANCFETNHPSRRCPMESNCDQCKGKHHAKVHLKYQRESNKHGYIKRNGNDVDSTPESARSQSEIVSNGALEDKDTKMMNSLRDMQACLDAMHNVSVSN
uniref:CCHC-type domain-containing protein n=1 Tax=Cacopsylla melanoneura TaxID=428564 RepID=A0A8D8RCG7_9HEMI